MPIFYFSLFLLSPLIITTSPKSTLTALDMCCMLCLSRRAVTYSCCHLLQAASLNLFTCFCCFPQQRSSFLSSTMSPSAIFLSLSSIMLFGVKIGHWMSSSILVSGLLFMFISISSSTSSNSLQCKLVPPSDL